MKGWKIATIVLAIALFLSLVVANGSMEVEILGLTQQITDLKDRNATLTDQIKNPETGYKKQIADLTAQLAVAPKPLRVATFQGVMEFVAQDKTNELPRVGKSWGVALGSILRNNAENEGLKTGLVTLVLGDVNGIDLIIYNIAVFPTTDQGDVFIDPQGDKAVTVQKGKSYSLQNGLEKWSGDDTIIDVIINW